MTFTFDVVVDSPGGLESFLSALLFYSSESINKTSIFYSFLSSYILYSSCFFASRCFSVSWLISLNFHSSFRTFFCLVSRWLVVVGVCVKLRYALMYCSLKREKQKSVEAAFFHLNYGV